MKTPITAACAALCLLVALPAPGLAAPPPASWDGLVRVPSKRLAYVYLAPGADFRGYTKVQHDPSEIAFRNNWLHAYNASAASSGGRLSQADAQKMMDWARTAFDESFAEAYADAGLQVVTAPGPDVLRVRAAAVDLSVDAPDTMSAGRSRTFSREAGRATLVLEVRDSESGALLGRAVDVRVAGDTGAFVRSSVSNRQDFSLLFKQWSRKIVGGLEVLKSTPPAAAPGD